MISVGIYQLWVHSFKAYLHETTRLMLTLPIKPQKSLFLLKLLSPCTGCHPFYSEEGDSIIVKYWSCAPSAASSWNNTSIPINMTILIHRSLIKVTVCAASKLSNLLVRSQKVGLLSLLCQYLHLKCSFIMSHDLCRLIFTVANLSSVLSNATASPVQLWCESYLTPAASGCEGGIAVHTLAKASRGYFSCTLGAAWS